MYPSNWLYNVSFQTAGGLGAPAARTSNKNRKKKKEEKAYFSIHIEVVRNYVVDVTMQDEAPETQGTMDGGKQQACFDRTLDLIDR